MGKEQPCGAGWMDGWSQETRREECKSGRGGRAAIKQKTSHLEVLKKKTGKNFYFVLKSQDYVFV
jgi:hypothetical protein